MMRTTLVLATLATSLAPACTCNVSVGGKHIDNKKAEKLVTDEFAKTGAVIKDPIHDTAVWREYLETIVKKREDWTDLYEACRQLV